MFMICCRGCIALRYLSILFWAFVRSAVEPRHFTNNDPHSVMRLVGIHTQQLGLGIRNTET